MTVTRKPVSSAASAFGIDIGGTGIKGAIVDTATGQLLTKRQRIARRTRRPRTRSPRWSSTLLDRRGLDRPGRRHLSRGHQARRRRLRGQRRQVMDRHRRRRRLHQGVSERQPTSSCSTTPTPPASPRRASARHGRVGRGHPAHLRHRHRQCAADRRAAGAQHRARPPRARRPRRRDSGPRPRCASTKDCPTSEWAKRVNAYMRHVERLFTPDLFVVGGGVSKDADKWVPHLKLQDAGQAGGAAEQRRHRRCCDGRRRAARRIASARGATRVPHVQWPPGPAHVLDSNLEPTNRRPASRPASLRLPVRPMRPSGRPFSANGERSVVASTEHPVACRPQQREPRRNGVTQQVPAARTMRGASQAGEARQLPRSRRPPRQRPPPPSPPTRASQACPCQDRAHQDRDRQDRHRQTGRREDWKADAVTEGR